MTSTDYNKVIINGMVFNDVTNQTVSGNVYSYEEAVALSKGKPLKIYTNTKRR